MGLGLCFQHQVSHFFTKLPFPARILFVGGGGEEGVGLKRAKRKLGRMAVKLLAGSLGK